ncbi:hypothetical protein [Candidatus Viridilinea mediisalina]|uniref:DUF624 domain-containing protein n=1 Tax=Candidatus Viridilinea mediisalina TaxID=2024553 RepID=A0A2A6RLU8_9CHLR|nr:hypothetical protein [Candidatus Viridilinea mediisalina]PDW03876.1 hypothetical protein CJ255_06385 [Candidatus Viridilinea mediisalina]
MLNPLLPLGRALGDLFDEILLLLGCNMLWLCLSGPLWALAFVALLDGLGWLAALFGLVGVLPAGPATLGLFAVVYRVAEGRAITLRTFFTGMRDYAKVGWALMGFWVAGILLVLLNLGFYSQHEGWWAIVLSGIWLYALLFWLGIFIYAPALTILYAQPTLRLVLRDSALLLLRYPFFSFLNLFLMGLALVFSLALLVPILFFTISLLALWGMRATMLLTAE